MHAEIRNNYGLVILAAPGSNVTVIVLDIKKDLIELDQIINSETVSVAYRME